MARIIWISLFILSLVSCSTLQDNTPDNQKARCAELKRRIMFNGQTSNDTQAIQQRAQLETLNKSYRENDCE